MACPKCGSHNVKRTQRGLLFDDYLCKSGHPYAVLNKFRIVRFVAMFTGGVFLDMLFPGLADAAEAFFDSASDAVDDFFN